MKYLRVPESVQKQMNIQNEISKAFYGSLVTSVNPSGKWTTQTLAGFINIFNRMKEHQTQITVLILHNTECLVCACGFFICTHCLYSNQGEPRFTDFSSLRKILWGSINPMVFFQYEQDYAVKKPWHLTVRSIGAAWPME